MGRDAGQAPAPPRPAGPWARLGIAATRMSGHGRPDCPRRPPPLPTAASQHLALRPPKAVCTPDARTQARKQARVGLHPARPTAPLSTYDRSYSLWSCVLVDPSAFGRGGGRAEASLQALRGSTGGRAGGQGAGRWASSAAASPDNGSPRRRALPSSAPSTSVLLLVSQLATLVRLAATWEIRPTGGSQRAFSGGLCTPGEGGGRAAMRAPPAL